MHRRILHSQNSGHKLNWSIKQSLVNLDLNTDSALRFDFSRTWMIQKQAWLKLMSWQASDFATSFSFLFFWKIWMKTVRSDWNSVMRLWSWGEANLDRWFLIKTGFMLTWVLSWILHSHLSRDMLIGFNLIKQGDFLKEILSGQRCDTNWIFAEIGPLKKKESSRLVIILNFHWSIFKKLSYWFPVVTYLRVFSPLHFHEKSNSDRYAFSD